MNLAGFDSKGHIVRSNYRGRSENQMKIFSQYGDIGDNTVYVDSDF